MRMKARAPGAPESLGADHLTERPTLPVFTERPDTNALLPCWGRACGMNTEGRLSFPIASAPKGPVESAAW